MKYSLNVFLVILFFSCNNQPEKEPITNSADSADTNAALQKSMKGFDLYAWEKDGKVFFTLLPGTNRIKRSEEIYDVTKAVEGISAIKNKINEIDTGQYIFLKPVDMDTGKLKPLIEYIQNKNLKVTVLSAR